MKNKSRKTGSKRLNEMRCPYCGAPAVFIGFVPSASMEPTLHQNSIILGLRPHGELEAGEIIIFRHEEKLLVKRIAACGGEEIERNGEMLTVPKDCFYVLGDNAEVSYDSRYWEEPFVKEEDVIAVVLR